MGATHAFVHELESWSTGHFNYHVEHHMMPYLPRQYLPLVSQRVRKICALDANPDKEARPTYKTSCFVEAFGEVYVSVGKPI